MLALGRASARQLHGPAFLLGRDTRQSGPMLAGALGAGLSAEGVDVIDLGVITTPGLAYLATARGLPGAMISASHNPYADNGIKLFSTLGAKLDEASEHAIEVDLDRLLARSTPPAVPGSAAPVGEIREELDAWLVYGEHLVSLIDRSAVAARRLVVVCDCANGAASAIAPSVLARVGVELHVLHASPTGTNINEDCGSTHPEDLMAEVLAARPADIGLCFDGDADRLIAVDGLGRVVDGDALSWRSLPLICMRVASLRRARSRSR